MLLTADDVVRRAHYRNAQRTLDRLLDLGMLPIVNENDTVATDEIRFGDNDRLAALVAHLARAEAAGPAVRRRRAVRRDPRRAGARRITEVRATPTWTASGSAAAGGTGLGTGGMATKVDVGRDRHGGRHPDRAARAAEAAARWPASRPGTYFAATGAPAEHPPALAGARRRGPRPAGARRAARSRRSWRGARRCCPPGSPASTGTFDAGDPVDLCDGDGHAVARGLVNYDASEIPGLLGRSTRELARELGPEYEREVVHRDDMVILAPSSSVDGHRARATRAPSQTGSPDT